MFTEVLDNYVADFGVYATWFPSPPWSFDSVFVTFDSGATMDGATTTDAPPQKKLVLFDQPDVDVLARRAISREYRITYSSNYFVGMGYGDAIDIAGTSYKVLTVTSIEDGAFYEATLERV